MAEQVIVPADVLRRAQEVVAENPRSDHVEIACLAILADRRARLNSRLADLTPMQAKVLTFVVDFIEANGFSPSLDEIAIGTDRASRGSAHYRVKELIAKGKITMAPNRPRSIALVDEVAK